MKTFVSILVTLTIATTYGYAQSSETFSTIRLEDPTTNNTVTLAPPSLTQSYSLTFPTSAPTSGPSNYALMFNRVTQASSFGLVPQLNLQGQQVAYLDPDGVTLRGSSGLLWDTTATRLNVTTSASNSVLSVTRSTASTTPLATFTGGNVGVGTTSPNTALDVDGDFAIRELNYTDALASASNHNFDFGNNNRAGYVRVATSLTADRTFTGFVGGRNGKQLIILNRTGRVITLANESTSSVDTTRIRTATDGSLDVPNQASVTLLYSAAEQRWRVTAISPVIVQAFTRFEDVVATGDTEIPANNASYIKVTNNSGNRNVTLPNGLYVGQILVVQNLGPDRITVTGANVTITPPSDKLDAGDAAFFVWDGADWQMIARKQ